MLILVKMWKVMDIVMQYFLSSYNVILKKEVILVNGAYLSSWTTGDI